MSLTREEQIAFTKLTDEEYFNYDALSHHLLCKFYKGPGNFKAAIDGQLKEETKDYQRTGNLFDSIVTDELSFAQKYQLIPDTLVSPSSPQQRQFCFLLLENWKLVSELDELEILPYAIEAYQRTYKKKQTDAAMRAEALSLLSSLKGWVDFISSSEGRITYTYADHQQMMGMYQSLFLRDRAGKIFKKRMGPDWDCRNQQKILFELEWNLNPEKEVFKMKGMLDSLCINEKKRAIIVTDLKTTALPIRNFLGELDKYNYDQQLYLYTQAALSFAVLRYPSISVDAWSIMPLFIVVCKEEPYETGMFKVPDTIMERGRHKLNGLLRRYVIHRSHNKWNLSAEALIYDGYDRFNPMAIENLPPIITDIIR